MIVTVRFQNDAGVEPAVQANFQLLFSLSDAQKKFLTRSATKKDNSPEEL